MKVAYAARIRMGHHRSHSKNTLRSYESVNTPFCRDHGNLELSLSPDFQKPCNSQMLRKLFRPKITTSWNIIEKDAVDEIIFRSGKTRNRLILDLMARGGMRIGEVLKLTASDLQERKLTLREPKSGRAREVVFIPQKVADRLREYAASLVSQR